MPYAEVKGIPLRYLAGVELNDASMEGSAIRKDDSNPRRFCGEGDFDIKGFVRCVQEIGYKGPWGVEVIGEDLVSMTLQELPERAFTTTASPVWRTIGRNGIP